VEAQALFDEQVRINQAFGDFAATLSHLGSPGSVR
jgi:hypothetical protein